MIFDEFKEEFAFIEKTHTRDAAGNPVVIWTQSEVTFKAAIRFDISVQAKRAQADGVQDLYTIVTSKAIDLEFNDVVKRIKNGKTYRVTTNGEDNKTPDSAGLNMRAVSAKVWAIPDNEVEEPEVTGNDENGGAV